MGQRDRVLDESLACFPNRAKLGSIRCIQVEATLEDPWRIDPGRLRQGARIGRN